MHRVPRVQHDRAGYSPCKGVYGRDLPHRRHNNDACSDIIPRLGNIRAEIMADRPAPSQEMINASNNIRMGVYQGLTTQPDLGDPLVNYELLRQTQRMEAYEKGQIPSGQMVGLSPLILIPLIQRLASGPPVDHVPPAPHISARDLEHLRRVHDSLIFRR